MPSLELDDLHGVGGEQAPRRASSNGGSIPRNVARGLRLVLALVAIFIAAPKVTLPQDRPYDLEMPAGQDDAATSDSAKQPGLLNPPPPPDPPWPTWTPGNDLSRQPVSAPAGYYELIGPPTGFAPDEEGQEYERQVASEYDLFYHEATAPSPIEIYRRPDGMAPAGVFADHTLNTGGRILMSYRYNMMGYSGLRNGTSEVSAGNVLKSFPLAPTRATFETQYFTFEYGPTDDVTFLVTLPIVQRRIDYVNSAGQFQATDITDLYDISAYMNYVLCAWDRQQIHLNLGVRIPVGVFDELGQPLPTPTSPNLTYPMRTSDGTWDFLPGITYRGQSDYWTWGVQALGTTRFGVNKYGYRLGDDATLNVWLSRKITDSFSLSSRLNAQWWGNIFEADARLNPNLVPTNRTDLQAGERLEILFGTNYVVPSGVLQGQRLGVEGGIPLFQDLSGPQLQVKYELWANLTIVF